MKQKIVTFLYVVLTYAIFFFLKPKTLDALTVEDGWFESLTAVLFLAASIILLVAFVRDARGNDLGLFRTKRNVFYLLLAVLFFFGFGEEISWGQRLLHLETPTAIAEHNLQGELNLHNLELFHGKTEQGVKKGGLSEWITAGRLFQVFWVGFCLAIPLLAKASRRLSEWLKRINLPVVPLWLGGLMLATYLLSRLTALLVAPALNHGVVEVKESNEALVFALIAVFFLVKMPKKARPEGPAA